MISETHSAAKFAIWSASYYAHRRCASQSPFFVLVGPSPFPPRKQRFLCSSNLCTSSPHEAVSVLSICTVVASLLVQTTSLSSFLFLFQLSPVLQFLECPSFIQAEITSVTMSPISILLVRMLLFSVQSSSPSILTLICSRLFLDLKCGNRHQPLLPRAVATHRLGFLLQRW